MRPKNTVCTGKIALLPQFYTILYYKGNCQFDNTKFGSVPYCFCTLFRCRRFAARSQHFAPANPRTEVRRRGVLCRGYASKCAIPRAFGAGGWCRPCKACCPERFMLAALQKTWYNNNNCNLVGFCAGRRCCRCNGCGTVLPPKPGRGPGGSRVRTAARQRWPPLQFVRTGPCGSFYGTDAAVQWVCVFAHTRLQIKMPVGMWRRLHE